MSVHLDTSQLEAFGRKLADSGPRLGAKAAAAVRKTAYDIEADAKILAPVDTGNLEGSISTTVTGDGRGASITVEIGPTAEYGVYQEFGTSTQPGQPYLGPAFDRRVPGLTQVFAILATQDL